MCACEMYGLVLPSCGKRRKKAASSANKDLQAIMDMITDDMDEGKFLI